MHPFLFCMNLLIIQIAFFKPPFVQTLYFTDYGFGNFRILIMKLKKNIAVRAGAQYPQSVGLRSVLCMLILHPLGLVLQEPRAFTPTMEF